MSTPIDSLPTEILTSIFKKIDRFIDRLRSDATTHSLLNALLVCRYWHTVIIPTPSLWTTVWIGDRFSALITESSMEDKTELPAVVNFKKRLERSGGTLPLDVIVHYMAPSDELLVVLQPSIDRWASITFLPGAANNQVKIQSYFNLRLPNLHTVDIRLDRWYMWDDRLIIDAPQLRTLKSMRLGIYFLEAAPPLVYVDVTDGGYRTSTMLYRKGKATQIRLESIQSCKETIEFLSLVICWEPLDHAEDMPITFPRLHTLRLNEWSIYASIFLRRFSFPALRTLHIGWMVGHLRRLDQPIPEDLSPFPNFHHLRELQWEGSSPDKLAALQILLASTPNLQILSDQDVLGSEGEGGALITALLGVAHDSTQVVCPMLREVHVQRASADELDLLTADIGRSALKFITAHSLRGDVGVDNEAALKRVRERGVELRIGGEN